MRGVLSLILAAMLLCVSVQAVEVSEELQRALPDEAVELLDRGSDLASSGMARVAQRAVDTLREALRASLRGAVLLALTVFLCGAAEGFGVSLGAGKTKLVPLVGVLCITTLAAGDLNSLIGLGAATMQELSSLSKALLPTMALAMASGGFLMSASIWQVGTLLAVDFLMGLIQDLLLPLTYCHIALSAAGAALPESHLDELADGIKKLISWALCALMTLFTFYLSVSNVLSGSADRAAVNATKAAVAGAIPVVGGILSETTEAVLSAAHSLRAVVGAVGIFGVLFLCIAPLVRLGVQFLLYKGVAYLSAVTGLEGLQKFLERLGGAFGLVLGMTGACALLILVALLVSISMVVM